MQIFGWNLREVFCIQVTLPINCLIYYTTLSSVRANNVHLSCIININFPFYPFYLVSTFCYFSKYLFIALPAYSALQCVAMRFNVLRSLMRFCVGLRCPALPCASCVKSSANRAQTTQKLEWVDDGEEWVAMKETKNGHAVRW